MKKIIVIGSGAGGAMAAHMLAKHFEVTVLEAGKEFKPFSLPLDKLAMFRKTGLYFDERMIQLLLPSMRIDKQKEMVMVYGRGLGGTTTLATGNAVRADEGLKKIGINLDEEFNELYRELPITTDHQRYWSPITKRTFQNTSDGRTAGDLLKSILYLIQQVRNTIRGFCKTVKNMGNPASDILFTGNSKVDR